MIIEKIKLCEIAINEIEGEFVTQEINNETVPAMLTNYCVEMGYRRGLIKSSLSSDLFALYGTFHQHGGSTEPNAEGMMELPEGMVADMGSFLDDSKILPVIYMACVGANKNFKYSYDEFLERYHADIKTKMQTYINLIVSLEKTDKQAFAKEFKAHTKAADGKKK